MEANGAAGQGLDPIVVEHVDNGVVVHLRGDIDAAAAPGLRTVLAEVVDQAGGVLRIHMADVDFIDSVGLSVLVAAYNRATERAMAFELAAVSPRCLRVFEITRLIDVFTIVP